MKCFSSSCRYHHSIPPSLDDRRRECHNLGLSKHFHCNDTCTAQTERYRCSTDQLCCRTDRLQLPRKIHDQSIFSAWQHQMGSACRWILVMYLPLSEIREYETSSRSNSWRALGSADFSSLIKLVISDRAFSSSSCVIFEIQEDLFWCNINIIQDKLFSKYRRYGY